MVNYNMIIKSDLIKVETVVNAPIEKVWEYWAAPKLSLIHI